MLALLALAGTLLTIYLSYIALSGSAAAGCTVDSGCGIVQASRFSRFFGIPVALCGLGVYAVLLGLGAARVRSHRRWRLALPLAGTALAISLYLTAQSIISIEALCPYCLASLALMAAIFAWLVRAAGVPEARSDRSGWLSQAAAGALLSVVVLHLYYSGMIDPLAGPEEPRLAGLAQHLADSGAAFYGAYWCPHCQDQKALFGGAAHRLPYVECSPGGRRSPAALACTSVGIRSFPTWIIDGRRYTQILEPERLARLSGFDWTE
ncbi:MAG: vitamin K epoxide reductase family protein [Gammaproteobacteria bacterium]|nr:vitamin K epoxide reductase family protein [Gammaproteobacteria bacterium]